MQYVRSTSIRLGLFGYFVFLIFHFLISPPPLCENGVCTVHTRVTELQTLICMALPLGARARRAGCIDPITENKWAAAWSSCAVQTVVGTTE